MWSCVHGCVWQQSPPAFQPQRVSLDFAIYNQYTQQTVMYSDLVVFQKQKTKPKEGDEGTGLYSKPGLALAFRSQVHSPFTTDLWDPVYLTLDPAMRDIMMQGQTLNTH